jgi:hypothetical protein
MRQNGGNYTLYFGYCRHVKGRKFIAIVAYQLVAAYVQMFLSSCLVSSVKLKLFIKAVGLLRYYFPNGRLTFGLLSILGH